MLRKIALILALTLMSSLSYAGKNSDFGNVFFKEKLTKKPIAMGYGGYKLIELMEAKEVKGKLKRLRRQGTSFSVEAEKFPAMNSHESMTTRITFYAIQQKSLSEWERVARLVIDTYSRTDIMDDSPTFYRVGEVEPFIHRNP